MADDITKDNVSEVVDILKKKMKPMSIEKFAKLIDIHELDGSDENFLILKSNKDAELINLFNFIKQNYESYGLKYYIIKGQNKLVSVYLNSRNNSHTIITAIINEKTYFLINKYFSFELLIPIGRDELLDKLIENDLETQSFADILYYGCPGYSNLSDEELEDCADNIFQIHYVIVE